MFSFIWELFSKANKRNGRRQLTNAQSYNSLAVLAEEVMNTTNLFVELIIIGLGTLACILSVPVIFLGYEWLITDYLSSPLLLAIATGFSYVLGISMDRLADAVYKKWDKGLRSQYFEGSKKYHETQTFVYIHANEKISSLFEYGRSRIRIMRSWAVIFFFLGITLSLALINNSNAKLGNNKFIISLIIFLLFEALAVLSFFSWSKLSRNNYERLNETYEILVSRKQ